jgi:integrase
LRDIFGRDNPVAQGAKTGQTRDIELIYKELHTIANKEYEYQCSYFPKMNNKRLIMEQDQWTMYFMRGVSLKGREIDFSKIKCSTLRYEIKLYYRECVLKYRQNFEAVNSNINLVAESINFLTDICPYVKYFADVDITHAVAIENFLEYDCMSYKNDTLSVQTIATIFSELRGVIDFLKENALEQYELGKSVYYPVPQSNPFREVKFVNSANMHKNTEVIPEEVMNQLLSHKDELKPIHQLEFSIMNDTAMRAKEVLMLEADCLNGGTNEIYYIPYKTVSARRKKALPDRRLNYVTDDVRILIEEQIDKTSELREKFNIPYIFINDTNAISSMMPSSAGFCYAINKLIEKYDIRDYDNNLWRFNCRQSRKTVARTMILNDATPMEIMAVLGHTNPNTAYKHYEELEKMKLEDMNTDFYKKQFEVSIGEENLANFSEEERRALYIDFRLSYRDVELGKCTKGFHEKPCGKITGKISCGLCSKCATGKKYLPEWIKLKNSQEILVKELVMNFEKENITGYEDFVEYKREVYFLDTYTDVVQRLENERD